MTPQGQTTLGKQVQRYRKLAGMSGEALAEAAGEGLTRSVIANLENGRKSDVTVHQLMAISSALHVPPVALLADLFDPGAPSPYPLPSYEVGNFDFDRGEPVITDALTRQIDLATWVGGEAFRTRRPIENQATAAAERALWALRAYSRASRRFLSVAVEYRGITERDDAAVYATHVQQAAEDVMNTIDAVKSAGVHISETATQYVHSTLKSIGLSYMPLPVGYGEHSEAPER